MNSGQSAGISPYERTTVDDLRFAYRYFVIKGLNR